MVCGFCVCVLFVVCDVSLVKREKRAGGDVSIVGEDRRGEIPPRSEAMTLIYLPLPILKRYAQSLSWALGHLPSFRQRQS
jgi:hypothetical protein